MPPQTRSRKRMESDKSHDYTPPQSVYNNPTQYNISIGEIKHSQILNAGDLERLKQVDPRLIDLFIDSYKKEQEAVQALRIQVLELEKVSNEKRYQAINKGQNYAFLSYVIAVVVGIVFAFLGHEVIGASFAILMSAVTRLSSTFITGEHPNDDEK